MTRSQLEHVIRAAGSVSNDDEIIIIGSQAVLGQYPEAPKSLLMSIEADVFPKNKPRRWDLIDGSIGEESFFHRTYGYYAQGVGEKTAVLPKGWKSRLIPIRNANTRGVTGWALEIHDLLVSKLAAGRDKDLAFAAQALRHGLAKRTILLDRVASTTLRSAARRRVEKIARALPE